MSWTKRQRIEAVFNGEQPDRVPIYDLLVNDEAVEFYAGKKLNVEGGYETVCEAISNCLDMTRDIFGPMEVRDYVDEYGTIKHNDRWSGWTVKRYFDGDDKKLLEYIEQDIENMKNYNPSKEDSVNFKKSTDYTQSLIKETVDIFVCPNINVNRCFNMIGMEAFCMLIYDEPELMARWLMAAEECDLQSIDAFADYKSSPVSLIYGDVAQKGNLIFPKNFLVEFMMPHVTKVCDLLHQKGMKVVFHSDGNIMSILPELRAAGVDGLNPLETMAGMDIKAIKEAFGRKFIICGGIDVSALLPFGTKDEVIAATKDLIKLAGNDYGLCIGSSTELDNCVPLENIKAMFETVWEYGRYSLKF